MRAIIQRVQNASVRVDGEIIGAINKGILVFVGFSANDNDTSVNYMLNKIFNLRIFEDSEDKMNLSVKDIDGEVLIISNFTLYGDCRKGMRPSYSTAAPVDRAKEMYDNFIVRAKETYDKIECGQFQADMKVELLNDGPVTLMIDSDKLF